MSINKTFIIFMIFVLVLFIFTGIQESYSQHQKIKNYQQALIITTACRLQPNINPDVICGKIPTWEQYK